MPSGACILLQPSCLGFYTVQRGQERLGESPTEVETSPLPDSSFSPRSASPCSCDPDCGEWPIPAERSLAGSAVLTDLLSATFLAECRLSGSQNPTKPLTDPLRSSQRPPRWARGCSPPHVSQELLSLPRGPSPPNPARFHRGRTALKCQESTTSVASPGKLGMLKPHYSPSWVPQGPAGIFSPPDSL